MTPDYTQLRELAAPLTADELAGWRILLDIPALDEQPAKVEYLAFHRRVLATIDQLQAALTEAQSRVRTPGTIEVCSQCMGEYDVRDCTSAACPIRAAQPHPTAEAI